MAVILDSAWGGGTVNFPLITNLVYFRFGFAEIEITGLVGDFGSDTVGLAADVSTIQSEIAGLPHNSV